MEANFLEDEIDIEEEISS